MKAVIFLIWIWLSSYPVFAQKQDKIMIGGGAHVLMSNAILTSNDNSDVPGKPFTYAQYADSINKNTGYRNSIGFSAVLHYTVSKKWMIQTGLTYLDLGFSTQQTNLKFKDSLYPGMGSGRLEELSSAEKSITYNYRYRYLQVPLIGNYLVYQTRGLKYTHRLTGGLGFNFLIGHDVKAELNQFVVDGESEFVFDSTGYNSNRFGLSIMLGYKLEIRSSDKQVFYIHPTFGVNPLSSSLRLVRTYPYFIQLNVGVLFSLND